MRKLLSAILVCGLLAASLTGCGKDQTNNTSTAQPSANNSTTDGKSISVISREDGSGTRGAFIELMGIEVKGEDGTKTDMTTVEADIANKTDVMLTDVSGDPYAIGYVSLGSMNATVKALKIEGVEATKENITAGTYPVARPFNIATKGEPEGLAEDFIGFILSKEGQEVVADGYIEVVSDAAPYAGSKPAGSITVAGSSSVAPVMEKLIEAYQKVNPDAAIELQTSDSTAGMTGAAEGTCDIGMASRELKDSEKETLNGTQIALDGIAVIVNLDNPADDLTKEQVRQIYTGEVTKWADVQ